MGEWYLRNLVGNLHAQQDWELFAPIEVGQKVRNLTDRGLEEGASTRLLVYAAQLIAAGRNVKLFLSKTFSSRITILF